MVNRIKQVRSADDAKVGKSLEQLKVYGGQIVAQSPDYEIVSEGNKIWLIVEQKIEK